MTYRIIVENNLSSSQYFYIFQQQAQFGPPGTVATVFSNSLGCQLLGNYATTGSAIRFTIDSTIYAGALSTMAPPPPPSNMQARSMSKARVLPAATAAQAIDLGGSGTPANATNLTVNPLGLSPPTYAASVPAGAFSINIPAYNQTPKPELFCGVASNTADQGPVLSSYIAPSPVLSLTCAPKQIYYIGIGYYPTGTQISYSVTNAAKCDFTLGYSTFTVIYNSDGTFSSEGM